MDHSLTAGWEPDTAIVDAVLCGRRRLDDLDETDRAVVVAELSNAGESVELIANRLGCTPRTVKRMRAWPLTRTLLRARSAEAAVEQWQSRAMSRDAGEAERLRSQVEVLSTALALARRQVSTRRPRRARSCEGQIRLF